MKKACALCIALYVMAILLSFISGRFFVVSGAAASAIGFVVLVVAALFVAVPVLFFYCAVIWYRTRQRSAVYVMATCLLLFFCVFSIPLTVPLRLGFRAFACSPAVMQDLNRDTLAGLLSSIRSNPDIEIYAREDGTTKGTLGPTEYTQLDSALPAHYRPPHVLFHEGPTGAYLVLEWGGPLLGRFGIAYDPGRKVIQEYTHVHERADSIFAVSKR